MIVIDGNITKRYSDVKEIPTEDFIEQLRNSQQILIPFLPDGCRGISSCSDNITFVVERNPGLYMMNYKPSGFKPKEFRLYYPWTYFFIEFSTSPISFRKVMVKFATKRPEKTEDKIGDFIMPNLFGGALCFGEAGLEITDFSLIHNAIDEFRYALFNTEHNDDYTLHIPTCIENRISEFCNEEFLSECEDPAAEDILSLIEDEQFENNYTAIFTWHMISKEKAFQKSIKISNEMEYGRFLKHNEPNF